MSSKVEGSLTIVGVGGVVAVVVVVAKIVGIVQLPCISAQCHWSHYRIWTLRQFSLWKKLRAFSRLVCPIEGVEGCQFIGYIGKLTTI